MPAKIVAFTEEEWAKLGHAARGVLAANAGLILTGEKSLWRVDKDDRLELPDHLTPAELGRAVEHLPPGG